MHLKCKRQKGYSTLSIYFKQPNDGNEFPTVQIKGTCKETLLLPPKPTGIGLGFPTWLRKNQQKHPLEDYTIKLTPTEVQLAVVYIMEGTVFGTNGDSHLLPIGCHLNRNGQPQNLEFTDINIVLWCFDDQKINVRCHNQPYTVIWSKPKVFSFYLKNVRLPGKNGEQILS